MSVSTMPPNGLSLRGIPAGIDDSTPNSTSAILLRLNDDLLRDVKKASSTHNALQFLTGSTPKIRVGKRTIDLTLSSDAFRHELYSASAESLGDMHFAGVLSHRAQLKLPEKRDSVGSDAALAALQNTLASYQQEKQAKAVNISSSIIAAPENRFKAAKEHKQAQRRGLLGSQPASPSLSATGTPRIGVAPTSTPATDSAVRSRAMRTPLIHLLAIKPLTREEITQKTRIPKDDLEEVLPKVGKQVDGKWQLTDRAYKELDVHKFGYSSEDRQAAIDNAIRAYDRMRLGKDEKIWQMLLPKEDRDKGIVLSKLHLGAGAANRGLTPNYAASPMLGGDGTAEKVNGVSAANTPRLGPSGSTPKPSSSGTLSKTLFAKDPKKARAAEEAKERKRKDREASDREGGKPAPAARKRQTTKANNPKVLSAELVHSSDEDDSVEEKTESAGGSNSNGRVPAAANERKIATNAASANLKAKPAATAANKTARPPSAGNVSKTSTTTTTSSAKNSPALSAARTGTNKATAGKNTPSNLGRNTPSNNLSAPSSTQNRSQVSPQNRHGRPTIPSPLGAARPRTAGQHTGVRTNGAETPKGLGILGVNGVSVRKRVDTKDEEKKPTTTTMNGNGIRKPTGTATKPDAKRKAPSAPSPEQPPAKHHKTESSSASSSVGSSRESNRERSDSGNSSIATQDNISFRQAVNIARQFREEYYPKYTAMYDLQEAMEKRGEVVGRAEREKLWSLHRKLEEMKRMIGRGALREGED